MARMASRLAPFWCWKCRSSPGKDCPRSGKSSRQIRYALKRELTRELCDEVTQK